MDQAKYQSMKKRGNVRGKDGIKKKGNIKETMKKERWIEQTSKK